MSDRVQDLAAIVLRLMERVEVLERVVEQLERDATKARRR